MIDSGTLQAESMYVHAHPLDAIVQPNTETSHDPGDQWYTVFQNKSNCKKEQLQTLKSLRNIWRSAVVDYTIDHSAVDQQEANISELKKDHPKTATPVACKLFTHTYDKCPMKQSSIRKFLKIEEFIGNQGAH